MFHVSILCRVFSDCCAAKFFFYLKKRGFQIAICFIKITVYNDDIKESRFFTLKVQTFSHFTKPMHRLKMQLLWIKIIAVITKLFFLKEIRKTHSAPYQQMLLANVSVDFPLIPFFDPLNVSPTTQQEHVCMGEHSKWKILCCGGCGLLTSSSIDGGWIET